MTKSKNISRRSVKQTSDPINTRSTAKPTGNQEKNQTVNRTATAVRKEKKAAAAAKSTPHDVANETMEQAPSGEHRLSVTTNSTNQAIALAPAAVRLTDLFVRTDDTFKSEIHGCDFCKAQLCVLCQSHIFRLSPTVACPCHDRFIHS